MPGSSHNPIATSSALLLVGLLMMAPSLSWAQITVEDLPSNDVYNDFVVGPGKVELTLRPGESRVVEVTVANRMGNDRTFTLAAEDFVGSSKPDETITLLGNDHSPYTLRDFLLPEVSEFTIQSGTRARIKVTVSVPKDAEPGGRYGSVLVGTVSVPQSGSAGVAGGTAIVSRIGVLFFITVPGEVAQSGTLTDFDTITKRHFFDHGPIAFSLSYENTGNIHQNPYGVIDIANLSGKSIAQIPVDPWYAMPQSLRIREVNWDRAFLFGRYVATARINRGYGDIVDERSTVIWVLPWKIMLGIVLGLALLVALMKFLVTHFEIRRK